MRRRGMSAAAVILPLLFGAVDVSAQLPEPGSFQVLPSFTYAIYDDASSLTDGWGASVDFLYHIRSGFQLGLTGDVLATKTEENFFPRARLDFENFVELWDVRASATFMNYGVVAAWTLPNERFGPGVEAGVAGYTAFMSADVFRSQTRVSGWGFFFGGSLSFSVGERTGINIHVRDYIYQDWDRDEFNPVSPDHQDTSFPESGGSAPAAKGTANRLQVSLGFRFVP